ncbi:hypothetical protein ACFL2H_08825 [Planctomycetota bacterium]
MPGVLLPGTVRSQRFVVDDIVTEDVIVDVAVVVPENSEEFDWEANRTPLLPPNLDPAVFDNAFDQLVNSAGTTNSSYLGLLSQLSEDFGAFDGPVPPERYLELRLDQLIGEVGQSVSGSLASDDPDLSLGGITVIFRNQSTPVQFSTSTSSDGSFVIGGISEGEYTITLSTAELLLNADLLTIGDGESVSVDIDVTRGAIVEGRFENAGLPLSGLITIWNSTGEVLFTGQTLSNGQFEARGIPTGTHTIQAEAVIGNRVARQQIVIESLGQREAVVLSSVNSGDLIGELLLTGDVQNQLADGISLTLLPTDPLNARPISILPSGVQFEFQDVAVGQYELTITGDTILSTVRELTVGPGAVANIGIVSLGAGATISGNVVTTIAEIDLPETSVAVVLDSEVLRATTVEADGAFVVRGLPPGTFLVRSIASEGLPVDTSITLEEGEILNGVVVSLVPDENEVRPALGFRSAVARVEASEAELEPVQITQIPQSTEIPPNCDCLTTLKELEEAFSEQFPLIELRDIKLRIADGEIKALQETLRDEYKIAVAAQNTTKTRARIVQDNSITGATIGLIDEAQKALLPLMGKLHTKLAKLLLDLDIEKEIVAITRRNSDVLNFISAGLGESTDPKFVQMKVDEAVKAIGEFAEAVQNELEGNLPNDAVEEALSDLEVLRVKLSQDSLFKQTQEQLPKAKRAVDAASRVVSVTKSHIKKTIWLLDTLNDKIAKAKTAPTVKDGTWAVTEGDIAIGSSAYLVQVRDFSKKGGPHNTVLVEDSTPNDKIKIEIVESPERGAVRADGTIIEWLPRTAFDHLQVGEKDDISFTYKATDEAGGISGVATINLIVAGLNDAPTANNLMLSQVVAADQSRTFSLLSEFNSYENIVTDPDDSIHTFTGTSTYRADLSFNNLLEMTYDPTSSVLSMLASGEVVEDTITFVVTDSQGANDSGRITIRVRGTNPDGVGPDDLPDPTDPGDENPGDENPGDENPGDENPGDPGDGNPGDGTGTDENPGGSSLTIPVAFVGSVDPNDIIGPDGYGSLKWVTPSRLDYRIRFENDPDLGATAPAQFVQIIQEFDDDFELRSLRLGDLQFSTVFVDVPVNRSFFTDRIDAIEELGVIVDVFAGVDLAANQVFWEFSAIDPDTGEAPLDPFVGLLPVNDDFGIGEGFVTYSIFPKSSAPSGAILDAQARIIFDTNGPIDTPPIFNTIDAQAPTSKVDDLPALSEDGTFSVTWSGIDDDNGSAVRDFTIFVSENGGPFAPWLNGTDLTSAQYVGTPGSQYQFYSVARDNAGNVEQAPSEPDAETLIATDPDVGEVLNLDGAGQNSIVRELAVDFNTLVTLDDDAFTVELIGGQVIATSVRTTRVDGHTRAILSFSGAGTEFGSLDDGEYRLTVHGNRVRVGDRTMPGDLIDEFYRLFGDVTDSNGESSDRIVGLPDFNAMRSAFGSFEGDDEFNSALDFNNDGIIGLPDFNEFRRRFGTIL